MSRYLLRFKIETCLTYDNSLMVAVGEHQIIFLFLRKHMTTDPLLPKSSWMHLTTYRLGARRQAAFCRQFLTRCRSRRERRCSSETVNSC